MMVSNLGLILVFRQQNLSVRRRTVWVNYDSENRAIVVTFFKWEYWILNRVFDFIRRYIDG